MELSSLYQPAEIDFLTGIFDRFPKVRDNFNLFLAIDDPATRFDLGIHRLTEMPRKGWVDRHVENPETVDTHQIRVGKKAALYAPKPISIGGTKIMGRHHDLPETIVTDFTPTDPITKPEKYQLERLSSRLILLNHPLEPLIGGLLTEHADQKTPRAKHINGFDKLDPCLIALGYEITQPKLAGMYEEFCAYAEPRVQTSPVATEIFRQMDNNEQAIREIIAAEQKEPWEAIAPFVQHLERTPTTPQQLINQAKLSKNP